MKQIRRGVFETNSSSVHVLTLTSKEEYGKWVTGELLYNRNSEGFISLSKALNNLRDDGIDTDNIEGLNEAFGDYSYYTEERYYDEICEYFEAFRRTLTTPKGEEIIVFGYIGHDSNYYKIK